MAHMSNICQVLPFLMKRCKTSKRYVVSISYMSKWEDAKFKVKLVLADLSSDQNPGSLFILGIILPSYMGIMIRHYKNPC